MKENGKWTDVLALLKKQISKPAFATWLEKTTAKAEEGNKWVVFAPNTFARDWIESRYMEDIKDAIFEITQKSPRVILIAEDENRDQHLSELKIERIMEQINVLTSEEKEQLFSRLALRYP